MSHIRKIRHPASGPELAQAIPSIIDGLIPTQRKVLHTLLQRKSNREIKVIELAYKVCSLDVPNTDPSATQQTIIKLAQNFVGANNINYLEPGGNFGSRRNGGEDAAEGRMNGNSRADMRPMEPWYRSWTGRSERLDANHFILSGNAQKTAEGLLKITELPPKRWPRDFKKALERHISEATSAIKSYTQIASPIGINFEITLKDKQMDVATQRSLEEELGLHHIMTTENLIVLDADGQTQQYHTELDMLEEFYLLRFQAYQTRKQHLLKTIQKELTQWTDQFRFANMILNGELDISQEETSLAEQLHQRGFASIKDHNDGNTTTKKRKRNASEVDIALAGYGYLFNMAVSSTTRKALNELEYQIASKRVKMDKIQETTIQEMWEADLREFLVEWDTQLQNPPVQEGCVRCGGQGCQ
ncbi:type II DNA topoisomerase [Aureobasidium pullulans]|uniref:DNA topoisomerase (ATP-hydrolyzing) n=1 Tax=Aureobasidium pullulans TaxID=5580 RepID=A0A4S9AQ64_AURPU|nr:type II DNA topoisomerase [Aureobasidium pullulans]